MPGARIAALTPLPQLLATGPSPSTSGMAKRAILSGIGKYSTGLSATVLPSLRRDLDAQCPEVVLKLLELRRAKDDRRHIWLSHDPVHCHLRQARACAWNSPVSRPIHQGEKAG